MTISSKISKTVLLIELVASNPVLYDTSHSDYKNITHKNKIWETIAEIHGHSDGELLKKQWKNLRDCYSKYIRSSKVIPGQAGKFVYRYKSWPWAERMAFLRPYLEFSENNSNDQRNDEEASTSQTASTSINKTESQPNDFSQFQLNDTPKYMHSRRKRNSDLSQSEADKLIHYFSQNTQQDDDVDLLFKSYSKKLKKMSARRQAIVKFEIAKIMMRAEIEESDEMQSRSDSEQYLDDNMVMVVNRPASSAGSDTKDSPYFASSPPVYETFDPLSSTLLSYDQRPIETPPNQHIIIPDSDKKIKTEKTEETV